MIQPMDELTPTQLKNRLLSFAAFFQQAQDEKAAKKIRDLAQKLHEHAFGIAFCGHFSAGKSRMINELLGENLLPSSPIPTSANLVKVHAGEEYALVHFREGTPRKYLAPYDYEQIKSFCQDGDAIASIELSHADVQLPPGTVILDTPGIDSADDAHRIATESAVHLADLIFYVMDYNHVQSEVNFRFTQELTAAGKEVCLVINQIDKHSAAELSFSDFQASVEKAFAAWGVKPAAIFYTSLLPGVMETSDFPRLQGFLRTQLAQKDTLLLASIQASLSRICQEHLRDAGLAAEQTLEKEHALLAALPPEQRAALQADCEALQQAAAALQQDAAPLLRDGIQQILNNAYLMPFSTRALAEAYLEACQPDFHIGFFFQKKKTLQEREQRQNAFWHDLQEKTQAQLEWHLRNLLLDFFHAQDLTDDALLAAIQAFTLQPPLSLLDEGRKDGARLTQDGSFVLNYTENTADAVKRFAKKELQGLVERLLAARKAHLQQRIAAIEQHPAAGDCQQAARRIAAAEAAHKVLAAELQERLTAPPVPQSDPWQLFAPIEEQVEIIAGAAGQAPAPAAVAEAPAGSTAPAAVAAKAATGTGSDPQHLQSRLQRAAELLTPLPGLGRLGRELASAAQRLAKKQFLVTLFGAFSAGKSSFANALLGTSLLPVSPNPTTAAINKIRPVDEAHPHGTVCVKFKDCEVLLADLNRALKDSGRQAASLDEARQYAAAYLEDSTASQRSAAFLRAFLGGLAAAQPRLGQGFAISLDDFPAYAAQEEKSCFVEWIEIYFDCALTRQGITLVDTPGADSINARHTDMSFDFIRRSDAVLFVTYYNHAFSRADREFLIQLGRVKDAFQLDKMFFIVNAIDLAADDAEQAAVLAYIRQNLLNYGIHSPQLHAISSQQLLADKCAGRPGCSDFEQAFARFVREDLTAISCQAAAQEYQRAVRLLAELLTASREAAARQPQQQAALLAQQQQAKDCLQAANHQELLQRLQQEAAELLYYAGQRVALRFSDFFRESFNPATLKTGTDYQRALSLAARECLEAVGFDFAQEMRATSVRLEAFWRKSLQHWLPALENRLQAIQPQLSFAAVEAPIALDLSFAPAFAALLPDWQDEARKHFRNPRSFFEAGDCRRLEEALTLRLQSAIEPALRREQSRLQTSCQDAAANAFCSLQHDLQAQLDDFYESQQLARNGAIPPDQLQHICEQLQA